MHELTISPKTAFITTLVITGALLTVYGAFLLSEILLILFGAIIFASAIHPLATQMTRRGLNSIVAILVTYLFVIGALIGLLTIAVPPMIGFLAQVMEKEFLTDQLAALVGNVRLTLVQWDQLRYFLPMVRVTPEMVETINSTSEEVGKQALPFTQHALTVVGQIGLLLVLAFYWLMAREETLTLFLKLSPKEHRPRLWAMWNQIESRLGAYLRGQALLMIIIGIASYLGLLALQVPNALALAVIAGLFEAIPLIGPVLGAIPAIAIALLISPLTALFVLILYGTIQVLEANILVPKIMSANVGLNPLVVMIAVIAGSTLNGVVGALVAIPIAGALQVIVQQAWMVGPAETTKSIEKVEEPDTDDEERLLGYDEVTTLPPGAALVD